MNPENPYLANQPQETLPAQQLAPEDRQWGMFSHLSAFAGLLIPLGSILGPFVMYLAKKHDYPFGSSQAKEALNFNISCLIYGLIAIPLCFIFIGFVLIPAIFIGWIIFTIIATMRTSDGIAYRYPLTIRLVH